MKKTILISIMLLLNYAEIFAFCGFYVAKADASLFNNKSQIILVRDGNRNIITMANDFKGNVKEFAMVVPVPVVLKKSDVRVVNKSLFDMLDAYSAPRLVEYYDENPCHPKAEYEMSMSDAGRPSSMAIEEVKIKSNKSLGIKIEAEYTVGEYDIIILSATQSDGLKQWLIMNDYKIPSTANEVLEPYIKNNMKFFVVKVNLDNHSSSGFDYLRPIQISFNSDRFMLPLRLGMANASTDQEMLVYAFTRKGRIEAVNYRTIKIPTDRNIPVFVKEKFNKFYVDLFNKSYKENGKNAVFLEYAWNVSPVNNIKCDPCVSQPPVFAEFKEAGVDWANDFSTNSDVFFTRLHVRYSRNKFPQDLVFQVTPNRENFQARYILTHPAQGDLTCSQGQAYLRNLVYRRQNEIDELASLTNWNISGYDWYVKRYSVHLDDQYEENTFLVISRFFDNMSGNSNLLFSLFFVFLMMIAFILARIKSAV
ncbi:MAG: DUF2330 domain-containing protein [Bacteroidia bacterium]